MSTTELQDNVSKIREFNRFYTRKIGVLREELLHSKFSLTESRIIYELANNITKTASDLCKELGLDPGYISRILQRFEDKGIVNRKTSEEDGRTRIIQLTGSGLKEFELLNKRSNEEIEDILNDLPKEDQKQLLTAMNTIERILNRNLKFSEPFFLRSFESGDMGWVVHRHGVLYRDEYGWNEEFEALVAEIVSDFIKNYKPDKERCWIAEMNNEIVGSVFVVKKDDKVAKLRLLLVEPKARGFGLGTKLVEECIKFAKNAGYEKMTLWTNSILVEARHIYKKVGFELVDGEDYHGFGKDLTGETWDLDLH